jgi:hypothetical protein
MRRINGWLVCLTLLAALVLLVLPDGKSQSQPQTQELPASTMQSVVTNVPAPPPNYQVTPEVPLAQRPLMPRPAVFHVCPVRYGFCADIPGDEDQVELTDLVDETNPGYFDIMLADNRQTGEVCPSDLANDPRCRDFVIEFYGVHITEMPGVSAQQALASWKRRMTPGVFTGVHYGEFAGQPAIFSTFHTKEGGSGPYVDAWNHGRIYHLWTNGLTGKGEPPLAQMFLSSFHFTP